MVWREKGLKHLKFAVAKNESQNHQGGKGLAVCLVQPAYSEQGQLDQITKNCAQSGFDHILEWRPQNLSGWPVLVCSNHHSKKHFLMF